MTEVEEVQGAMLPDGIDVDEAAAYFGVVDSSDSLHSMLNLGIKESDEGNDKSANLSDDERVLLEQLTNTMYLLKLFSIAHFLGGEEKVMKYVHAVEGLLNNPDNNKEELISLCKEFNESLSIASTGNVPVQINILESTAVPITSTTPTPQVQPTAPPIPTEPEETAEIDTSNIEESVPLPGLNETTSSAFDLDESVPLPTVTAEKKVEVRFDERKNHEMAFDAFSGAFEIAKDIEQNAIERAEISPTPEPVFVPEPEPEPEPSVENKSQNTGLPKPVKLAPVRAPLGQSGSRQIPPTIKSGVSCFGCGIGLDNHWNHCPVCGAHSRT